MLATNFMRVRKTNCTDNGFPSRLPQANMPFGNGNSVAQATASAVWPVGARGQAPNGLMIKPYGAGANNATFSMRVIGWSLIREDSKTTEIWDPTILVEVLCTISSTVVGLAGRLILNTDLFADTIALVGTSGNDDVSIDIVSPANDTAACLVVDVKGSQLVEFTFTTGASATNCNALAKVL